MTAWPIYLQSLEGGALIGAAAALFLLLDGRIAGISGIAGGLLDRPSPRWIVNACFIAGLVLGPALYAIVADAPLLHPVTSWPVVIAGGLLVGFGTRLGSGCTSGHGVSGLARLSPRSLAAVMTFMAAAIVTVFVTHHLLQGAP